ncbi:MAG: dTDP-4-dehydrorhamnose 3,5-epimerase [Alphaproteobacteria bacterium]
MMSRIEVQPLVPAGLKLIKTKRFGDSRGYFTEAYSARDFGAAGIADVFVQDNSALSVERGTVRGLHFQSPPHVQAKLVRAVRGRLLDVAVDLRKGSPTFGQHCAVELSAEEGAQFYIPGGFAHGYCTLEPMTEVLYKVTDYYVPEHESGVLWNDPSLGIAWPDFAGAQVSERDGRLPRLADLISAFTFAAGGG